MDHARNKRRCWIPCPTYDLEAMESWLTELAAEGWFLAEDGLCFAWAVFLRGAPQPVKYRLTASLQPAGFGSDGWLGPEQEARALHAAWGWEYVAKGGNFYVYRAWDKDAREPDTEPQTQELVLRAVHQRENRALFSCVFWGLLYPLFLMRTDPLLTVLEAGLWPVVIGLGVVLWFFCFYLVRSLHYRRLRKRLQAGQGLDHQKPWRDQARRHHVHRGITGGLLAALVLSLLPLVREAPMPAAPLPFPTVAQLCAGTGWDPQEVETRGSQRGGAFLAPAALHWQETAQVVSPAGPSALVTLVVDYYHIASPRLAEEAAGELLRRDQRAMQKADASARPLSLPPLPVDWAVGYHNDLGLPTVILRQEGRVLRAVLLLGEGAPLTLDQCLTALTDSLTAPS